MFTTTTSCVSWYEDVWTHVPFDHPKTFDKLAMDPAKKKEIMDDLDMFRNGKEYHNRVGKAWKRGYLLYGPPGTGKSTMVAAMANYLDYDVYDLELTSVKTNTELRKLLIEIKSKSIIVFEDIDCSLDLTGARNKKKAPAAEDDKKDGAAAAAAKAAGDKNKDTSSKVTLSGLLNFIDGLWSACGGERIIVFTTNHVQKLDPALIRRGRMDKHIEMSYCGFEAFKFLAKTYLDVDAHALFGAVGDLLREVEMTPADVAENLTPRAWRTTRTPASRPWSRHWRRPRRRRRPGEEMTLTNKKMRRRSSSFRISVDGYQSGNLSSAVVMISRGSSIFRVLVATHLQL